MPALMALNADAAACWTAGPPGGPIESCINALRGLCCRPERRVIYLLDVWSMDLQLQHRNLFLQVVGSDPAAATAGVGLKSGGKKW